MNIEEYRKLMALLDTAADYSDKPVFVHGEKNHREKLQEAFWGMTLKKQKQLLDAMMWRLIQLEVGSYWGSVKRSIGGSKTNYAAIHEEAQRFYKTGEYTTWGAAKKAVELAEMNPGEFGTDLPGIPAVNTNLKNWLKEQE